MRDFAWNCSTLYAVVREDGSYAGIPCTSAEEARELANQHEGAKVFELKLASANYENKPKVKTAAQEENEALGQLVCAKMIDCVYYGLRELRTLNPETAEFSTQKMSAIMRTLVSANLVKRVETKQGVCFVRCGA